MSSPLLADFHTASIISFPSITPRISPNEYNLNNHSNAGSITFTKVESRASRRGCKTNPLLGDFRQWDVFTVWGILYLWFSQLLIKNHSFFPVFHFFLMTWSCVWFRLQNQLIYSFFFYARRLNLSFSSLHSRKHNSQKP